MGTQARPKDQYQFLLSHQTSLIKRLSRPGNKHGNDKMENANDKSEVLYNYYKLKL